VAVAAAALAASFVISPSAVPGSVPASIPLRLLCAATVLALSLAPSERFTRRWRALAGLAVVGIVLLWSLGIGPSPMKPVLDNQREGYSVPRVAETYGWDGGVYLRTRELMEAGVGYYAAFGEAVVGLADVDVPPSSPFNYRPPFLFWLWTVLPGPPVGMTILWWHVVLGFVAMAAAFFLARRFVDDGVALLAPITMLPAIAFAAMTSSWYSFSEAWAGLVVVFAFLAMVRKRWWPSIALLLVAVAMRELMVVFVPAWVVAWYLGGARKRMLTGALAVVIGSITIIGAHVLSAPVSSSGLDVGGWLGNGGLDRLFRALQHGTDPGSLHAYLQPALLLLALVGAALVKTRWLRWSLMTGLVVPAAFLMVFSAGEFDYYWGAILIPLTAALAPLAFQRLAPASIPSKVVT
jgi:hypothetical protein